MDDMKTAIKDRKQFAEGSKFLVTGCQESEECNLLYITAIRTRFKN